MFAGTTLFTTTLFVVLLAALFVGLITIGAAFPVFLVAFDGVAGAVPTVIVVDISVALITSSLFEASMF